MKNILILGANGKIAHYVIENLIEDKDVNLKLFLRNSNRLEKYKSKNVELIEGDVSNEDSLKSAIKDADIVYANLAGDNLDDLAKNIIKVMDEEKVKRLIFIASIGVLDEVPGKFGEWNNKILVDYLPPYKRAVTLIEKSDLVYTIIRPAWLTDKDEVDYEVTSREEAFKGTEVSRKSIGSIVTKIMKNDLLYVKGNIGVNKPNTDGDKPAWY